MFDEKGWLALVKHLWLKAMETGSADDIQNLDDAYQQRPERKVWHLSWAVNHMRGLPKATQDMFLQSLKNMEG